MERFPALRLVLRLGRAGAAIVAVLMTLAVVALAWSSLGWLALACAPIILAFVYFLMKSYVEIIQIITEMVH